jgi:hypothetical protein
MSSEIEWYGQALSPGLKYLELFGLADAHRGNPFHDRNCWLRAIDYIANKPEAYAVLVGDLCECVVAGSKGDTYTQRETPQEQRDGIIADLMPIRDKILGATTGNHEQRIYERTGMDITMDIATALGIPYDQDGILLKVSFGNFNNRTAGQPFTYWIHATHGYGGARTRGGKLAKVERMASFVMADVAMMGHDHDAALLPYEVLSPDPRGTKVEGGWTSGKVKAHRTLLVKCSAFLKWGGYARSKGFAPSTLISPTVLLGGEEKPWPMANPSRRNQPEVRGVL